jgi:hypothetical protein
VTITNTGAGHAVPTGTPTKHVVVGVHARSGERWLVAAPSAPRAAVGTPAPAGTPLAAGDWRSPPGTVFGVFDRRTGRLAGDFWAPPGPEDVDDRRLAPDGSVTLEIPFELPEGLRDEPPVVEVRVIHRRMPLDAGPASLPFEPTPLDAPPEVEWERIVR